MLITSAGALPPSYAARPIISPSLGIDQRAGESQLGGREGGSERAATSARSTQALCSTRHMARNVGRIRCLIRCMIEYVRTAFVAFYSRYKGSIISTLSRRKTYINNIQSRLQESFPLFFLIQKFIQQKWKCGSLGPSRSGLCHGGSTFEFFCTIRFTIKQMVHHKW